MSALKLRWRSGGSAVRVCVRARAVEVGEVDAHFFLLGLLSSAISEGCFFPMPSAIPAECPL